MATTNATKRLWAELMASIHRTNPQPERGSLCSILGSHDPDASRTCRDCGKALTERDEVCRAEVYPPIGGRR